MDDKTKCIELIKTIEDEKFIKCLYEIIRLHILKED